MRTESLKKRYKRTSKLINGYSQVHSMERALGFKELYDLQSSVGHNPLINASDVVNVCHWMLDHGFDVRVPIERNQQETNPI